MAMKNSEVVKGFYQTMDDHIYARLEKEAKARGLKLQELIRVIVSEWLESTGTKKVE